MEVDQSSNAPLFSLNDMFDIDYISRFRQLSATIGGLAPRDSAAGNTNGGSYVLIIPAKAFGGKSVIEEVWRLWRFCGGRRGPTAGINPPLSAAMEHSSAEEAA